MSDKPKSAAQRPEMTRIELVRALFELYRDLYWLQEMDPRLRQINPSRDAMRHYREAWDVFIEDRDWLHWRDDETRRFSDAELRAEIAVSRAEMRALEIRRSVTTDPQLLTEILRDTLQSSADFLHSLTRSNKR